MKYPLHAQEIQREEEHKGYSQEEGGYFDQGSHCFIMRRERDMKGWSWSLWPSSYCQVSIALWPQILHKLKHLLLFLHGCLLKTA